MAKVLILAGDAAEDLETMFVKYRLVEAGHEPYVAAPTMRPIKLGPTEGDLAAVESGLTPGEQVVVDGSDKLREGAKVEPISKDAAAAPTEGARQKHGGGKRRRDGDAATPTN